MNGLNGRKPAKEWLKDNMTTIFLILVFLTAVLGVVTALAVVLNVPAIYLMTSYATISFLICMLASFILTIALYR